LKVLESADLSTVQKSSLAALRRQVDQARARLRVELTLLGTGKKAMVNEQDLLLVRQLATQLLMLDPEHTEALQLLSKAKQRGAQMAAALVNRATPLRNIQPTKYQELLRQAARLDPDGEQGKKAVALLHSK
jgi:hypothetical protein